MNVLNVQPQTFRDYADITETMAAAVAVAGAVDQAAVMAAVVPTFGLIGQEFLLSFAVAQANHLASLGDLVQNYAGTALLARNAADAYERSENESAEAFGAAQV
ncbi:type VII secretion target [Nocardia sp. NPDC003979]